MITNGTLRLMPDDSPIMDDHHFALPDEIEVAQNCHSILPSQCPKLLQNGLSMLHINARSLHQSHGEIVSLVANSCHGVHFILISETWLDPNLLSGYQLPEYDMLHSMPADCSFFGKGCAMYIRKDLSPFCKKLDNLCVEKKEFQCILVEVRYPAKPVFLVGATYRSPSFPIALFLPYLETTLNSINDMKRTCFWGGDWNVNLFQYNDKADVKAFLDCLNSFNFFPTITIPTRVSMTPPYTETLIDNIYTNFVGSILHSCTISCGIADHQAVLCSTDILSPGSYSDRASAQRKFNFARLDELKENIVAKLDKFNNLNDPEHACDLLTSIIQQETGKLSSTSVHRKTTPIQPWITLSILRSIKMRNKLLKAFLRSPSAKNESKFKKYRNVLRLTLRQAKKHYFQSEFKKYANNPRLLWERLLQAIQKQKVKPKPAQGFDVDGELVTNNQHIAEAFNVYYSNVASNLDTALGPQTTDPLSFMQDVGVPETMFFTPVSEEDVYSITTTLNDSSAGFDGISSKLLKCLLPSILSHLTHAINLCIIKKVFPTVFKEAIITPVFKGGPKTQFSSYRPISVLPVISKIIETIMYRQLMTYISDHNILFELQFGFRANHSTYMPISMLHDLITDNLTHNRKTAGIFLDLARAFDTVNINILLQKLRLYGISKDAVAFLTSYLTNRKHRVKFNGIVSGTKDITCGVPQGSVLGPLLFLIYINDLHKVCPEAKCLLFADDTAVFYSAPSMTDLQNIINNSFPSIVSWLHANRLSLSVHKTFYQVYSNSDSVHDLHIPLGNSQLSHATTVKYLGVLLDEDLKFKSHVGKVSGTISRHLGVIGRSRYLLNKHLLVMLYNALILPYLTYCACVWGSNYYSTLYPIIVAQKRAIRLIAGAPPRSHTSALFRDLRILKFTDLVQYQILNILHNLLRGTLPSVIANRVTLQVPMRPTRTTQHFSERNMSATGQVTPHYRMHNYRRFSLFCRAPVIWNNIVAQNIPDIRDVPFGKSFFKTVIKKLFIDSY